MSEMLTGLCEMSGAPPSFSQEEYLQSQADAYNALPGDPNEYQCEICNSKGNFAFVDGGEVKHRLCECWEARRSAMLIRSSGLADTLDKYTMDSFRADSDWQGKMKSTAEGCLSDAKAWLFLGGQSGCGKTHLCTAVVGELLRQRIPARYMLWRDEMVKIRAATMQGGEYQEIIDPLKNIAVLYIDDFLKCGGNDKPTKAELDIAFELINSRYAKKRKTIISSERTLRDLSELDEAISGRIFEMAKDTFLSIERDGKKNQRRHARSV